MRAYSVDLRHRIVESLEKGATQEETAKRFCVSLSSVKRYYGQWKTRANLAPKPLPGRVPILKEEDRDEFVALVASKSDWTLDALALAWQERTGVKPTVSVLCDVCKRWQITRKKRVASPGKEIPKSEMPTNTK